MLDISYQAVSSSTDATSTWTECEDSLSIGRLETSDRVTSSSEVTNSCYMENLCSGDVSSSSDISCIPRKKVSAFHSDVSSSTKLEF